MYRSCQRNRPACKIAMQSVKKVTHARFLESVRRDHAGLHSFLSMSLIEARRRNASALRLRISQSLARRLHRPSHANVRSTTPPLREDNKSFCVIGTLDDLHIHPLHYFCHGAAKQRALIAAIGVEFHQERIQAEHGRHHERAAVAILNVSSMNDGMNQQALRIDENVPLLALDLLSRVVARRVNRSPPFSALLTLWLSMTAAVGLASRPIASRHFT